jgi:putative redox protein
MGPLFYRLSSCMLAPLRVWLNYRCVTGIRTMNSLTKSYHLIGTGTKTLTRMSQPRLPAPIETDVPISMGGSHQGPQPIELLLASLCGCELVTAQFIARNMKPRVTIDRIDFDVHASRDQRGAMGLPIGKDTLLPPSRLERIWGTATVHTSASLVEVQLMAAEVKRRCPVANMVVLSGCLLEIEFKKFPFN